MKKPDPNEPLWRHTVTEAKGLVRYTFNNGRVEFHCGFSTKKFPMRVHNTEEFSDFVKKLESDDRREGEGSLRRFFMRPGEKLAYGIQTHSANVTEIKDEPSKSVALPERFLRCEDTDALVTMYPDVRLSVFSADCLTILIGAYDEIMPVAAVHAGWRGTEKNIAAQAVARIAAMGSDPAKCFALLGPALRSCCYEVGPEFREKFPHSTVERDGKLFFDVVGENERQLIAAGLKDTLIVRSGYCTSCSPELFYSWRREKDEAARMISWIVKATK